MDEITGIPPHVHQSRLMATLGEQVGLLVSKVDNQAKEIVTGIEKMLEDRALDQGHITSTKLAELLDSYKAKTIKEIQQPLIDLRSEIRLKFQNCRTDDDDNNKMGSSDFSLVEYNEEEVGLPSKENGSTIYAHHGKFFMVPKNFEFPKRVNLKTGLHF